MRRGKLKKWRLEMENEEWEKENQKWLLKNGKWESVMKN